jgi:hypothetical protein
MDNAAVGTLEVGDRLIYEGRARIVSGFTAMSVEPARIYLVDAQGQSPVATPVRVDVEALIGLAGEAA